MAEAAYIGRGLTIDLTRIPSWAIDVIMKHQERISKELKTLEGTKQ